MGNGVRYLTASISILYYPNGTEAGIAACRQQRWHCMCFVVALGHLIRTFETSVWWTNNIVTPCAHYGFQQIYFHFFWLKKLNVWGETWRVSGCRVYIVEQEMFWDVYLVIGFLFAGGIWSDVAGLETVWPNLHYCRQIIIKEGFVVHKVCTVLVCANLCRDGIVFVFWLVFMFLSGLAGLLCCCDWDNCVAFGWICI